MAVIDKADIVADVNENLNTNYSGTQLDRQIVKTLNDMSNRGLLVASDASQTLSDGSKTLNYPTGFRAKSAIAITLTDTAGSAKPALERLPGGHKDYRQNIAFGGGLSNPEWYSEYDEKFYLYGQASKAYTVLIEYRKNHPKAPDAIEFTTEFENLMFAGVTYWKAQALGNERMISLWLPTYNREMKIAVLNRNTQPSLMRG